MQWDLGVTGVAVLLGMAIGFGVAAQLMAGRRATRRLWLITAAVYLVCGVFISEVWFGWATQEDLQPNIDGLSFDEVLLIGLVPVTATIVIARRLARRSGTRGTRRNRTPVS